MPITSYIQSFIRDKIKTETKVDEMPDMLIKHFRNFEPIPNVTFLVAGYTKIKGTFTQSIHTVRITDSFKEKIDTDNQGASWAGECLILARLLQPVSITNNDGSCTDLPAQTILWNFFTLQDAIDFAKYAIETTINTMRFQNVAETVGHPIDILVIQPGKNPCWINKKELGISI